MHKRCTNKREETKSVVGKGIVSYGIEERERKKEFPLRFFGEKRVCTTL